MAKKAFTDDWTVRDYFTVSNSKHPEVTALDLIGCLKQLTEHENSILLQLFAKDPLHRPRISELRHLFQSYRTLTSNSVWSIISLAIFFPSFSLWTDIVTQSTSRRDL